MTSQSKNSERYVVFGCAICAQRFALRPAAVASDAMRAAELHWREKHAPQFIALVAAGKWIPRSQ